MDFSIETKLFVQNPRKSELGSIRLAGSIRASAGLPMSNMRVLGSYAIVYVVAGGGVYRDARGNAAKVRAGDLITIFPEIAHAYGPERGQTWSEIYIVFDGLVFDLWRKRKLLDPDRAVRHIAPVEYWFRRWQEVVDRPEEVGADDALASLCRLQQALADAFTRERSMSMREQDRTWLATACTLLDASREAEEKLVSSVAETLNMSYANFRKKFTQLMGLPPARYRMRRVMDHACELMFQQGLTNKELARRCGFCDEFHFSRRFKQLVGVSPREFRRQLPGASLENHSHQPATF